MKSYYWSGICTSDRINALDQITIIADRYATILNFQRFSDISLSLILETEEYRLTDLLSSLKNIMLLDTDDKNWSDSETKCIVLLNITFTKGSGDLKLDVPNIPG